MHVRTHAHGLCALAKEEESNGGFVIGVVVGGNLANACDHGHKS